MPCRTTPHSRIFSETNGSARRQAKAVAYLREAFEMSERRVHSARPLSHDHAVSGSRVDDVDLRDRMKAIAHERRRIETLFPSLFYARIALGEWRVDYNGNRPNSRLGWLTPTEYVITFTPRRDLAPRSMANSTPAPVFRQAQQGPKQRPKSTSRWIKDGGNVKVDRYPLAAGRSS